MGELHNEDYIPEYKGLEPDDDSLINDMLSKFEQDNLSKEEIDIINNECKK